MTYLAINKIRRDGGTQPRSSLNAVKVKEYADTMSAGKMLPDVMVFYDGQDYWLADGFHRVAAAESINLKQINANIQQGTRRDAILHSAGANAEHGLPRSSADKRRAVMKLLTDEVWSKWADREIARRCHVHHDTVGRLRKELSGGISQIETRLAERNGTTYPINTANIGSANGHHAEDITLTHPNYGQPIYTQAVCPHCDSVHPRWRPVKGGYWRCLLCGEDTRDDAMQPWTREVQQLAVRVKQQKGSLQRQVDNTALQARVKTLPETLQRLVEDGALAAKKALGVYDAAQEAPKLVRDVVLQYGASSREAVLELTRLYQERRETWNDIQRSGTLDGELPLVEATMRDIEHYLNEKRREYRMQAVESNDGESAPDGNGFNYKRDMKVASPATPFQPQGQDACQTPPYAIDPLLPYINHNRTVWEPAAGEGHLVEAFYDAGFQSVISSDLITGQNFLEHEPDADWNMIVTNPPFSLKYEFLERCYALGKPFALLVPVEMIGAGRAQALMKEYGFEMMLLNRRIDFKMPNAGWNGGGSQFPTLWLCWNLLPQQIVFGDVPLETKNEFRKGVSDAIG
jgi:ribosomal protein L37AE/L43A